MTDMQMSTLFRVNMNYIINAGAVYADTLNNSKDIKILNSQNRTEQVVWESRSRLYCIRENLTGMKTKYDLSNTPILK